MKYGKFWHDSNDFGVVFVRLWFFTQNGGLRKVDTYLFLLWIWMWLNLSSHLSVSKFLSPKLITSFARLCSKSGTMLGTHWTKQNSRTTQMQQAQMVDPRDAIVVSIQVQNLISILLTMLVREKMVDWCWSSFTWRCQKSMVKKMDAVQHKKNSIPGSETTTCIPILFIIPCP